MDTYTIIAEPTGCPVYVIGTFSDLKKAKNKVEQEFGTIMSSRSIDILLGSCSTVVMQFVAYTTVVSISKNVLE